MKLNETNKLSSAVRLALAMGSAATMGAVGTAQAQNADTGGTKNQNLETIVVTGSNIRRVDMETASPVLTIDHAAIEKSGKLTLGDLVQQLPSMAGAAVNPQSNNGSGNGASAISLRGLGSQRTLMLVNGHRVAFQDANQIPANAIERIDVLTDGASAVYGSDAVAGVVNFILRSNYQGAEFTTEYGISDRDDGARKGYHATFGQSTDKGSILAGVNYNKNEAVMAKNRVFSANAIYLTSGQVNFSGSSRAATGRVDLTKDVIPAGLQSLGCKSFTLKPGNGGPAPAGAGGSLSDYKCYVGSNPDGTLADAYNFQASGNYDLTPNERTGAFVLGNYKLTDNVEAYIELFHNKYQSANQQAEVPLDTSTDLTISSKNYYNPFGVDFAPGGAYRYRERLVSLGPRHSQNGVSYDQINTGFKGTVLDNWNWSVNFTYGHRSRDQVNSNYFNYGAVAQGMGPSYKDASGKIVCGTDPALGGSGPIAGCTPINIFNQADPATTAALAAGKSSFFYHYLTTFKEADANVSGTIMELPAGSLSLAGGVSDSKHYEHDTVDSVAVSQPPYYTSCSAGSSICASPTQGGYSVKEAYVELLIPVVKDLPFAKLLNVDLGTRYSKYSNFGSTNNWKAAIEYRPIDDLLLRGTVTKVFRAPTVTDIYGGPFSSSPSALDPCNGTSLKPGGKPNAACAGIPYDPSGAPWFTTNTAQITAIGGGSKFINYPIKPEQGKSYDFGFVYDPQWLSGLSISADYYRVTLNDLILSAATGDAAYILQNCYQNNGGPYCQYIHRTGAGDIFFVQANTINGGTLATKGADLNLHYRLPETPYGNFAFGLQTTYISKYEVTAGVTQEYAGHFDKTFGNYARWRALANIDWNLGSFSATWSARYIGRFKVGYPNANLGPSADASGTYGNTPGDTSIPVLRFGAQVYQNVSLAYTIEPINTTVRVGIDNLTDKQPPVIYFQNTNNANTDEKTYDTIGRFYYGSITVKF